MDENFNYEPPPGDNWINQVIDSTQEYQPPGYRNPTWDSKEHFSYEPPPGDSSSPSDPLSSGENQNFPDRAAGTGGSRFSAGSQFGENREREASMGSGSGASAPRAPSSRGADWLNETVTTAIQAMKPVPTYTSPAMGPMPTFNAPTWDKDRIKRLTQKNLGVSANKLGNSVSEAITRSMSMDNPLLQKEFMRGTLRGYGEGIGQAQETAGHEALNEYGQEFNAEYRTAEDLYNAALKTYMQDWTEKSEASKMNFEAQLKDYLNSITQTVTRRRS